MHNFGATITVDGLFGDTFLAGIWLENQIDDMPVYVCIYGNNTIQSKQETQFITLYFYRIHRS